MFSPPLLLPAFLYCKFPYTQIGADRCPDLAGQHPPQICFQAGVRDPKEYKSDPDQCAGQIDKQGSGRFTQSMQDASKSAA